MGFREGLESELGVKADRALTIKLIGRSLSSWLIYRLYCRLGAQRWQALGLVTVSNQLLGIARAIKGEAKGDVISFTAPDTQPDWGKLADVAEALFRKPESVHTERSEG